MLLGLEGCTVDQRKIPSRFSCVFFPCLLGSTHFSAFTLNMKNPFFILKKPSPYPYPCRDDPLYMAQIISSAIMNAPPPFGVVRMLVKTNVALNIDGRTRSKLVRTFWPRHPRTDKLLALRNWCDVSMVEPPYSSPMNPEDPEYGGLRFAIRAEHPKRRYSAFQHCYSYKIKSDMPRCLPFHLY